MLSNQTNYKVSLSIVQIKQEQKNVLFRYPPPQPVYNFIFLVNTLFFSLKLYFRWTIGDLMLPRTVHRTLDSLSLPLPLSGIGRQEKSPAALLI
jgi:hypothetical protein